jgi:hypothetical protein
MRNFGNSAKRNVEWLQSDACEVVFQHMMDIVSAATEQKAEEECGQDES